MRAFQWKTLYLTFLNSKSHINQQTPFLMKNIFKVSVFIFLLSFSGIQAQTITSVDPNEGTQCQQLSIIVTGENVNFMQGTSSVHLSQSGYDGIYPENNTVLNINQIQSDFYFNPDDQEGSYNVEAWNGSGYIVLNNGFYLNPVANLPQLLSIDPDTAVSGETFEMEIIGEYTHFGMDNLENVFLYASGTYIYKSYITMIDLTHLVVGFNVSTYTPAGSYSVNYNSRLDVNLTMPDAFTLLPSANSPEIVSVEPNAAFQGDQLTVTVTGTNTLFQQGSSMLYFYNEFNEIYPFSHTVINDTIITGDFLFNSDDDTGYYDVTVYNWNLGSVTLENGFYLFSAGSAPSLVSCFPIEAYQGTRTIFEIRTANTHFNTETNMPSVTLVCESEELYCHDITVVDSVTLLANFVFSYANAHGWHDLVVYAPLDGTMNLENAVNLLEAITQPTISSVVPDSANQGDALTISVTGNNIVFMQGTSQLSLTQGNLTISPSSQTIVNDSVLSGEFNFLTNFPTGKYDVAIDNGYAWPPMNLPEGFNLMLFDFMDEISHHSMLTIYPNPAKEVLNIRRNFGSTLDYQIQLFDTQGHLVLEEILSGKISESQLNLSSIEKGVYLLKVTQNKSVQSERIVIQ